MRMPLLSIAITGALLSLLSGVSSAGTFELNTNRGLWQLDGNLSSRFQTSQGPLVPNGFTIGVSPNSRFDNVSTPQYLIVNSSTAPFGGLKPAETLRMPNPVGANAPTGGAFTNLWTIVMDVRFPTIGGNYINLLQDSTGNGSEGELFINPAGQLQCYGATGPGGAEPVVSGVLAANTWYRIAITSNFNTPTNEQILVVYINGVKTSQTAGGLIRAPRDGRYAWASQVALFSDDNNETAITHLGALGYWGRTLFDDDIVNVLGSYSASGLTWPGILAPNATPPLPLLTGVLRFNTFVTNFTPPTGSALLALANSAVASAYPGAVCEITYDLGSNGGTIPGFPNHRFGGVLTIAILANGDAVSLSDTGVIYSGPGADVGVAANVSFQRVSMELDSSFGLSARDLTIYFPAGMSVALDNTSKRAFDRASFPSVPLNQSLNPSVSLVIDRNDLPGQEFESGLIYPCTERIPVRFATNTITWTVSSGQFTFSQSGNAVFHQSQQLTTLLSAPSGTLGNPGVVSNDFLFVAAKNVSGPVVFGSRSGGVSTAQSVTLSLDPATFGAAEIGYIAHHPLMTVGWTGAGSVTYLNNAITASSALPGAKTSYLTYARGVAVANCQGQAGADPVSNGDIYFLPGGRLWRITPDGGLSSEGSVGSFRNTTTDTPFGGLFPRWAGFLENGSVRYGHSINTTFPNARVMTAGQAVLGTEIEALSTTQRPYGLLGAGHGSPANAALIERPGGTGYQTGAADYPGANLRTTSGFTATSIIAGAATSPYPLTNTAKYYLRPGGVSGLHLSSSLSPISLSAYGGATFNLTALQLSYLNGINKGSGVNGNITILTPNSTSFALGMKRVLFGPQGQIESATLATPQPNITLGYWNFAFTPLGIDFPQPKGCPPPLPSEAFVRISADALLPALSTRRVTGSLGFLDGDIVTEAMPIAAGQSKVSRFEPGSELIVPGPAGEGDWKVNCTTGIYLNQKAASAPDPGSLNAAGMMNVPFFNDLEVHLRTPSATGGTNPLLHVRRSFHLLPSAATYDPAHLGRPDDGTSLADFLTEEGWHPVASHNWQDLISFEYRVQFQPGSNRFRSQTPASGNVLLFPLAQGVKTMTPNKVDLRFDGKFDFGIDSFLPQVNFDALTSGTVLPSGQAFVGSAVQAIGGLDTLLADQIHPLLLGSLQASANNVATSSFYSTLRISSDRNMTLDTLLNPLTTNVSSIFGPELSGLNGQARRNIELKIQEAINGLNGAKSFLTSASNFSQLASGIAGALGTGGSPAPVEPVRLTELRNLIDRAVLDLQAAKDGIGAPLATAMNQSSGGSLLIRAEVEKALKDLRAKWAPADPAAAIAMYNSLQAADFADDLTKALSDRVGGSSFAGQANSTLRKFLADPKFLSRQILDDALSLASSLLTLPGSAAVDALGGVSGKLASANMTGYAHINGDSLTELRLDSKTTLSMGIDEMEFDAHFILRDVDSSTPGGSCLAAAGAKAEVIIGASTDLSWTGQDVDVDLEGRVALAAGGSPVALFGDLKLVGEMDFSSVKMKELALGFGFGADNYYLYGKAGAKVAAMDVAAGIFIGRTCDITPITNADPDIGNIISKFNLPVPYTGAAVYAYGAVSLMPIIGIPPSCLLDLRVGGGQGFFVFDTASSVVAGYKTTQSVSGELLCIASVTGRQDTIIAGSGHISGGSPVLDMVAGTSRFTATGTVGYGWLSWDFEKSVGLNVTAPPVKFSIDY